MCQFNQKYIKKEEGTKITPLCIPTRKRNGSRPFWLKWLKYLGSALSHNTLLNIFPLWVCLKLRLFHLSCVHENTNCVLESPPFSLAGMHQVFPARPFGTQNFRLTLFHYFMFLRRNISHFLFPFSLFPFPFLVYRTLSVILFPTTMNNSFYGSESPYHLELSVSRIWTILSYSRI